MAEVAYDLHRFESTAKAKPQQPRVKVASASKAEKLKRRKQILGTLKIIAMCSLVVVLVWGVLSTQAAMAEIQGSMTRVQKQIDEEAALNTYLNSQLGEMVNLRNIEDKAKELGLVKMDASKVNYIRVEDGSNIEVRQGTLESFFQNVWTGFLSILGGADEG